MTVVNQLTTLEASGLVRLAAARPELEYIFRHALVQDAAYGSLVKHDRKRLHLAVGEVLERMYSDRLAPRELAPLLAQHFDAAGDDRRALKYHTLAGDDATRQYANVEAVIHYTRALELARRTGASAEQFSHLYMSRGNALELSARYREALENYTEMEDLAHARNDQAVALAGLLARAKIYATPNPAQDPDQARALLEQAVVLAREQGDRAAECTVLWNLMILLVWSGGDQRQAVAYGEASLALARELGLREQLAFTVNDLAYAYMAIDQWAQAQAAAEEASQLWREVGSLPMLADCLCNAAIIHIRTGDFEQAIACADEARQISAAIGNRWGQASSRLFIGQVYLERGQPDRAIQIMEEAIPLGEEVGHATAFTMTRAELGWAYASLGLFQRGLELARLAHASAAKERLPYMRMHPLVVLARVHILLGDLAEAGAALQQGYGELRPEGIQGFDLILLPIADGELAIARQEYARAVTVIDDLMTYLDNTHTRLFRYEALYLKGKALRALGRIDEAREVWMSARAHAEDLEARRVLWPILTALSEIEARLGNHVEADALRQQARMIVEYIADHAGTPDRRASFMNLPDVRAVLPGG